MLRNADRLAHYKLMPALRRFEFMNPPGVCVFYESHQELGINPECMKVAILKSQPDLVAETKDIYFTEAVFPARIYRLHGDLLIGPGQGYSAASYHSKAQLRVALLDPSWDAEFADSTFMANAGGEHWSSIYQIKSYRPVFPIHLLNDSMVYHYGSKYGPRFKTLPYETYLKSPLCCGQPMHHSLRIFEASDVNHIPKEPTTLSCLKEGMFIDYTYNVYTNDSIPACSTWTQKSILVH